MFGLIESGKRRTVKSRGVVLLRAPRRANWLAGWTSPPPQANARPRAADLRDAPALGAAPAKPRNRP